MKPNYQTKILGFLFLIGEICVLEQQLVFLSRLVDSFFDIVVFIQHIGNLIRFVIESCALGSERFVAHTDLRNFVW